MMSEQIEGERRALPNGVISRFIGGVEYLNTTQAAKYLGYSSTGMRNLLDRYEQQKDSDPNFVDPLPTHVFGPPPAPGAKRDTRPRYIRRSDLDAYVSTEK